MSLKILVTGAAGFIGSHLAQALCQRGASVVALDNLSTGRLENLAWRQPGDLLEFVQGEIGDEPLARKLVAGCDWVFHQAAVASVPQSVDQPLATNRDNLDATLQWLVLARDAGVKRFMFASSSAVYGDSELSPKVESMPVAPISPYGLQKYAAERYAQLFHRLYGLPTVCLRYFNVFGPRQAFNSPYSGVIARFCTEMLQGQAPTVLGDGRQSRDFVYVDNVVAANLLAAEAPPAQAAGAVFNVGGGQGVDLLQLIEEINRQTRQRLEPRFGPARAGDVRHSQADIAALRTALGYQVVVPWQRGLGRTLDFYRQQAPRP